MEHRSPQAVGSCARARSASPAPRGTVARPTSSTGVARASLPATASRTTPGTSCIMNMRRTHARRIRVRLVTIANDLVDFDSDGGGRSWCSLRIGQRHNCGRRPEASLVPLLVPGELPLDAPQDASAWVFCMIEPGGHAERRTREARGLVLVRLRSQLGCTG